MKNLYKIIIFLVVALVLVGVFFIVRKASAPVVSVAPLVSEKSQTEYSTTDMSYPQSSPTKLSEVFAFVQKSKNDFDASVASITPTDAKFLDLGGDRKYNLTVTTKIATSTKTVSYIIYAYTFSGGAHGMTDVATFTYDANGKYLTLDDVLISPYLPKISALAKNYFDSTIDPGYLQEDMINSGTAPTPDNYSMWYLTDKTITFIFGQYQVGPGVLGIQEFPLDKNLIKNICRL